MFRTVTAASLAAGAAGSAIPLAGSNGVWCAEDGARMKDLSNVHGLDQSAISFRGQFRDFSLFVEQSAGMVPNCFVFKDHTVGDDGLWVVEEPTAEGAAKAKSELLAAGQKIFYEKGNSFVASGGTELPNITGLDGCGASLDTYIIPVPSHSVQPPLLPDARLKKWQSEVEPNPDVELVVAQVSTDNLAASIEVLQNFNSRNSYSSTLYDASAYLVQQLETLGFTMSEQSFNPLMAPNLIATWTPYADVKEFVVAGAHMDSRAEDSTDGTMRAPGADDNGTGSAAMLELARIVNGTDLTFNRGLQICLFSGEEQGLLGSRALATKYAEQGAEIYSMVNADMLGYQSTEEIEIAFMNREVSQELTAFTKSLVHAYVPGVVTTDTEACCSDYASFYENGFPSVGFFESSNSATAYPSYHKTTDLLENVNMVQLTKQVQAVTATVFTLLLE